MVLARRRSQLAGVMLFMGCLGGLVPAAAAAGQPTLALTSSMNPVRPGAKVVLTATLSEPVVGGTLSFYENDEPIPGCMALPVTSLSTSTACTTTFLLAGSAALSADYSGDSADEAASGTLTQTITTSSAKPAPAPPRRQVGSPGPKGEPNFRLTLLAVRTAAAPYRYWFALEGVRCINHASDVLVTIGDTTVKDRCGARLELASRALADHHYYVLTLRPVRYRGRRIVARGPTYRERLFMPGSEVRWSANHLSLPGVPPAVA